MQTEKTGVIYRIYHKESMKSYIGKTIHPDVRIHNHFSGRGKSPAIKNAIKKYGENTFVVEILERNVPEVLLSKLEILYIRFYNSVAPHGYNLTEGGEGGKCSLETRQKIAKLNKGENNPNYGKKRSEKTRQKISEAHKGKTLSIEHRRKISEIQKGKTHSDETRRKMSESQKGRTVSEETRQKISEGNKGRTHSPEHRQKNSEAHKGRVPWNKGKTGVYKVSEETRWKISESLKRRNCSA